LSSTGRPAIPWIGISKLSLLPHDENGSNHRTGRPGGATQRRTSHDKASREWVPYSRGAHPVPVPRLGAARSDGHRVSHPDCQQPAEGVEVTGDGSIWYCETLGSRLVLQRPDRSVVEYPVPNAGQPNTLKIGLDGIWFTDQLNDAIGVLHPASGEFE